MNALPLYAHAIPQVDGDDEPRGIHLFWVGPHAWMYSPGGWYVQRREIKKQEGAARDCVELGQDEIGRLRAEREAHLRFGLLLLREGRWPEPLDAGEEESPETGDIFTLELDRPQTVVEVGVGGPFSLTHDAWGPPAEIFVYGLRDGKVVAGPSASEGFVELRAVAIDTVVVYARRAVTLRFCILEESLRAREEESWESVPYLVQGLNLPLRELMPEIEDEYAEAARRLLPGEKLDEQKFRRLIEYLRAGLPAVDWPPVRPVDQILLLRPRPEEEHPEELELLDPLRLLLAHPTWRRALGFSWFDQDPALIVGRTYEYRVRGLFPSFDLTEIVYGFHSIPSQTMLPAEFYMGDMRVSLPQPTTVERAPSSSPPGALIQTTRRGIALKNWTGLFWQHGIGADLLGGWSIVLDFAAPVSALTLELAPGHSLAYAIADGGGTTTGEGSVPPGSRPRLDFAAPVQRLALRGSGFLLSVRLASVPDAGEMLPLSVTLPPLTYEHTEPPAPPRAAWITNLQLPRTTPSESAPPPTLPHRQPLGFAVRWTPATAGAAPRWPRDVREVPPLDAAVFQIEHRRVRPPGEWSPLVPEENFTLGSSTQTPSRPPPVLDAGDDVLELYPEVPRPEGVHAFYHHDAFGVELEEGRPSRPAEKPGTYHQYRVRAVDAVGRPSREWRETNVLRLEKRVPPPLPVGIDGAWDYAHPEDLNDLTLNKRPPAPSGVQAQVIVRGPGFEGEVERAAGLSGEERESLRAVSSNAVILRWGWHEQQREQDPLAHEFRVYVSQQLDRVAGTLTRAEPTPGGFRLTLALERAVEENAARGLTLEAGYSYFIRSHTAGSEITAEVEPRLARDDGTPQAPRPGRVVLPLRWKPPMTRPRAWPRRVSAQPVTGASVYHAVLYDVLTLSDEHPHDILWAGVSAADDESYVEDEWAALYLDAASAEKVGGPRFGNESAIVPVQCEGRYRVRPVFSVTPALRDVPVFMAPEPAGGSVAFDLDLAHDLTGLGDLRAGEFVRPERASAADIFAAYRVEIERLPAGPRFRLFARVHEPRAGEPLEVAVDFLDALNPEDARRMAEALDGPETSALEGKYVVYLAALHPYADRLFGAATERRVPLGPFREMLPASGGRYVYRVRRANAGGLLSSGSAMAPLVVRVPSLAPPPAPEREPSAGVPGEATLRLRVPSDGELTHVLTFSREADAGAPTETAGELLRVPNRTGFHPRRVEEMLRLRVGGGWIVPRVKSLADADVVRRGDGSRYVDLAFRAGPGRVVQVWACALSSDRVPSRVVGPFRFAVPSAAEG